MHSAWRGKGEREGERKKVCGVSEKEDEKERNSGRDIGKEEEKIDR